MFTSRYLRLFARVRPLLCVDESVSACVRMFDFMEYGCVRRWKIENREDGEDEGGR